MFMYLSQQHGQGKRSLSPELLPWLLSLRAPLKRWGTRGGVAEQKGPPLSKSAWPLAAAFPG